MADLKHTLRQLRRSPGFALTAILTVGLGIGATTAIFTLVHAVLLRSLPVEDPSTLLRVGDNEQCCRNGGIPDYAEPVNDWSLFSYPQYEQFRNHTPGFANLAAFESTDHEMAVRRTGSDQPAQPWYGEFVSGNSFETLGLRPYAGRLLRPADDVQGAAPVAVISFETWQQKLGRDASAIGSSFVINGKPVTVVGIAPPGFYSERLSSTPPAFWLPIHLVPSLTPVDTDLIQQGDQQWLNLIGRTAPGANPAAIQSQMQVELLQFLESPLANLVGPERALIPKQYLRLSPGGGGVQRMQEQYKDDLHLLMWIASFVLLIACANLANLMLARSATQRQQLAVLTALGASRARLVQRALVECMLLALLGGAAGVLVAWGGAKLILHLAFHQDPISISASPSPLILAFAFAASLLTGLLFGVAPAWLAAQVDPIEALRGAHRTTGRHATAAQKGLVVGQAAVSVVLLCAAGLLILSLQKLQHQHFGFDVAHRSIVQINAQNASLQPDQLDSFYRRLDESLSSIPGVSHVAWSTWSPMDGNNRGEDVYVAGEPPPPTGSNANLSSWVRISPGYFTTIGTKLLQGRAFSDSDNRTAPNVAIVDEAFVKKYLHDQNPIGAHFGDWDQSTTGMYTIVGVVENAHYWPPNDRQEQGHPMYFLPAWQWAQLPPSTAKASLYAQFLTETHYMSSLEIETNGTVPDLEAKVTAALQEINPNLMITRFQGFAQQVNLGFSQQQMIVQLTSLFGLVALALAAIGLYGVTAYAVAQRTSEIGIRMALGANHAHVQKMVLSQAFRQVGLGLLIGIPAAIAAGHLMAAELYGVKEWNPLVLGTTTLMLGMVALLAAALPARRAAAVEPMEALRGE
ncbi:MAG TPA: ABC transporter permease [Acidobacteriaceae bacterium]|nr:ABC transporter permease [Acidobacteriaceae bacterium]